MRCCGAGGTARKKRSSMFRTRRAANAVRYEIPFDTTATVMASIAARMAPPRSVASDPMSLLRQAGPGAAQRNGRSKVDKQQDRVVNRLPIGPARPERMIRWPSHRHDGAEDDAPLDQRNVFPRERGERADDHGKWDQLISPAGFGQFRSVGELHRRQEDYERPIPDHRHRVRPQRPYMRIRTPPANCSPSPY